MRVLILGISGLFGSNLFLTLNEITKFEIFGTLRNDNQKKFFDKNFTKNIFSNVDSDKDDTIEKSIVQSKPNIVINCIGITKHRGSEVDPIKSIEINSILPYRISSACDSINAKFIQISSDCVFSGSSGNYIDDSCSDATDIYGKTKYLGEIDNKNTLTLRTSMIGHEINTNYGLLNWFLMQDKECYGYKNAIFSGLPSFILSYIIGNIVIPKKNIYGIYNIGGGPISKYELLKLIAERYKKKIKIKEDFSININRSLNSEKFYRDFEYIPPSWPKMIELMYEQNLKHGSI